MQPGYHMLIFSDSFSVIILHSRISLMYYFFACILCVCQAIAFPIPETDSCFMLCLCFNLVSFILMLE